MTKQRAFKEIKVKNGKIMNPKFYLLNEKPTIINNKMMRDTYLSI